MKKKRLFTTVLLVTLLICVSVTPVYAIGLKDLFGKNKLDYPKKYNGKWNGDYYEIIWEEVEGEGGYEVIWGNRSYKTSAGCHWFDIEPSVAEMKNGKISGNIIVSTLPSNKKYKQSDPISVSYSSNILDLSKYNKFTDPELSFLSKSQLEKVLANNGISFSEEKRDGYTVVSITRKDKNNSGLNAIKKGIMEVAGGALSGSGKAVADNVDNIAGYAIENGDGFKDTLNKGKEATGEYFKQGFYKGAASTALNSLNKDRDIHLDFYFLNGEEKYASKAMILSYMKSDNANPKEFYGLDKWEYLPDKDIYYLFYENFGAYLSGSCSGSTDRWEILFQPSY